MPKSKKGKMRFTAKKRSASDIAIEERLEACGRKEAEHIIYVGQLVENVLKGEFGAVLKALTAGRTSAEINANKDGKISSDRILGRIEMADALWNDLEQFVLDKDAQLRPIEQTAQASYTQSEERVSREEKFVYSP